jgi:hypothetical protein
MKKELAEVHYSSPEGPKYTRIELTKQDIKDLMREGLFVTRSHDRLYIPAHSIIAIQLPPLEG